jgi:hypothetical protein
MHILAGIDPGLSGALCRYDLRSNAGVTDVVDMPVESWGAEKRHINVAELMRITHRWGVDTVALERVNAMPGAPSQEGGKRRSMGAASAFRFGMCYGEVRGAMIATGVQVVDVPPSVWKDLFELRKRDKDDGRMLAIQLFPTMAEQLKRKKDVGRAESMLIARWAAQNRWEL